MIRKFDTPRDLMSLNESVIVNCTGLGSKTIFNDNKLVPVKGQLTVDSTTGDELPRSWAYAEHLALLQV